MADRSGRGQLGAWRDLGRGQGPRPERGQGSILAIFGPQGSKFEGLRSKFEGLRSKFEGRGRFRHFGPFWTIFGVQVPVPTQIAQGSERDFPEKAWLRLREPDRSHEGSGIVWVQN